MANWAKTTDIILDNGFGGSRNGHRIEGAVLHHVAGTDGRAYVAGTNARDSHPTYHVNSAGSVAGIVHPDRRPFSTADSVDEVAVTFEIDNSQVGGDWPISDAALEAVIEVCVDHAKQAGYSRAAVNKPGVQQQEFFIGYHQQYKQTACPGPFVRAHIPGIVDEVNRRLAGGAAPTVTTPAPKPATQPAAQSGWQPTDFNIADEGFTPSKQQWTTIQLWLTRLRRYSGPVDGVPGPKTWAGIQTTVATYGHYSGPVDGKPGPNTAKGMQLYAGDGGGYTGPVDGKLGAASWAGFVNRLSS